MLNFPAKRIRSEVIAAHVRSSGLPGVVCFSCGNASRALKATGIYVVDVAPGGSLESPSVWWTPSEISRAWPHLLDATSGHLPLWLVTRIGDAFKEHLGDIGRGPHRVPSGSGETVLALALAYLNADFVAVYGGSNATRYQEKAPLNMLVRRVARIENNDA